MGGGEGTVRRDSIYYRNFTALQKWKSYMYDKQAFSIMATDNKLFQTTMWSTERVQTSNFRNTAIIPAWKTNLEVQEKSKGKDAKSSNTE